MLQYQKLVTDEEGVTYLQAPRITKRIRCPDAARLRPQLLS